MEEKEMKVLTQKEFNEKVDKERHLTFKGYEIKYIHIMLRHVWEFGTVTFRNCKIGCMIVDDVIPDRIMLNNCVIVDYEKFEGIDRCQINDCIFIKPVPLACPEEGEFVGYKKCMYRNKKDIFRYCIVKLLIPEDAKRSSAFGRMGRCSKAKVLEIFDLDGNDISIDTFTSYSYNAYNNTNFIYKVGEMVYPDSFDENRYNECSHGIHFFMTFEEARDYVL